jgi:hypothetical protein
VRRRRPLTGARRGTKHTMDDRWQPEAGRGETRAPPGPPPQQRAALSLTSLLPAGDEEAVESSRRGDRMSKAENQTGSDASKARTAVAREITTSVASGTAIGLGTRIFC